MENIVDELLKHNQELVEETITQLAICQKTGADYDPETHTFLQQTLGMGKSSTSKNMDKQREAIDMQSIKISMSKEFESIKTIFGKQVISYKSLVKLCGKYNLYFGPTSLFKGEMTESAIAEAKAFDFIKAKSYLKIVRQRIGCSVIDWDISSNITNLIIAAPINMFDLHSKTKFVISRNEIIPCYIKFSIRKSKKCKSKDPILFLPFISKAENKMYFLIITNW